MTVSLDLGSGPVPKNPFGAHDVYGVDIARYDNPHVWQWDAITDDLPFYDSTIDYVVCTDFLEHIPRIVYLPESVWEGYSDPVIKPVRKQPFINVMNEVWRVLKPGGKFLAKTPAYPKAEAFQDPTHVNIVTENTWDYFAGGLAGLCREYGFVGEFEPVHPNNYWEGYWLVWNFKAIK